MQRSLFVNRRDFSLAIAALPFAALPSAARARVVGFVSAIKRMARY